MTIYVQDLFTDSDDTALNSHTPDVDDVGSGWFVMRWAAGADVDNGYIQGNQLQLTIDNRGHAIDSGQADCNVNVDWVVAVGVDNRNSVMFRRTSNGNQWAFNIREPNSDFILYEINSDSATTRDSGAYTWTEGNTYDIRIELDAQNIDVYIDDTLEAGYASASFNETATKHGLLRNGGANNTRFDNFLVEIPAVGGVTGKSNPLYGPLGGPLVGVLG